MQVFIFWQCFWHWKFPGRVLGNLKCLSAIFWVKLKRKKNVLIKHLNDVCDFFSLFVFITNYHYIITSIFYRIHFDLNKDKDVPILLYWWNIQNSDDPHISLYIKNILHTFIASLTGDPSVRRWLNSPQFPIPN